MLRTQIGMLFLAATVSTGCFHATIETDLPPSNQKIERKWANGWILGLVPPSTVETAEECTNGVAKVETVRSFLNQLVSILTIGIYTPMEIVVTCAEGRGDLDGPDNVELQIDEGATLEEKRQALRDAALRSWELGEAVYVAF